MAKGMLMAPVKVQPTAGDSWEDEQDRHPDNGAGCRNFCQKPQLQRRLQTGRALHSMLATRLLNFVMLVLRPPLEDGEADYA